MSKRERRPNSGPALQPSLRPPQFLRRGHAGSDSDRLGSADLQLFKHHGCKYGGRGSGEGGNVSVRVCEKGERLRTRAGPVRHACERAALAMKHPARPRDSDADQARPAALEGGGRPPRQPRAAPSRRRCPVRAAAAAQSVLRRSCTSARLRAARSPARGPDWTARTPQAAVRLGFRPGQRELEGRHESGPSK